jgi:glycosyltransferase
LELIKNYYCIIKQVNPDAVLAYTVKPDVYGGIVCAITKTPFIPNITGLGKGLDEKGIVQRLTIELYKRAVKKAKCVFFQNDLIDGKIYVGELTFYHNGGFSEVKPEEWNYKLGEMIKIDE